MPFDHLAALGTPYGSVSLVNILLEVAKKAEGTTRPRERVVSETVQFVSDPIANCWVPAPATFGEFLAPASAAISDPAGCPLCGFTGVQLSLEGDLAMPLLLADAGPMPPADSKTSVRVVWALVVEQSLTPQDLPPEAHPTRDGMVVPIGLMPDSTLRPETLLVGGYLSNVTRHSVPDGGDTTLATINFCGHATPVQGAGADTSDWAEGGLVAFLAWPVGYALASQGQQAPQVDAPLPDLGYLRAVRPDVFE